MKNRMQNTVLLALILLFISTSTSYAVTRWVNLAGSNHPPYTSFATGANRIQDAVDWAQAGDTVRIAAGLYRPDTTVFLKDSIAVIGAGRDSTTIYPEFQSVHVLGSTFKLTGSGTFAGGGLTLSKCTIHGSKSQGQNFADKDGIKIHYKTTSPNYITENRFIYLNAAVQLIAANAVVSGNEFDSNHTAIVFDSDGPYEFSYNTISPAHWNGIITGIYSDGYTSIHHNLIFARQGFGIYYFHTGDSILIYNNIIVSADWITILGFCACEGAHLRNNTFIRTNFHDRVPHARFEVVSGSETLLENNAFVGNKNIIQLLGDQYYPGGGTYRFHYNTIWGLDSGMTGLGFEYEPVVGMDTVGNRRAYPMFVGDSIYYLQRGSPLIDAGNPSIFDLDGTRSDIGAYGGPEGTIHDYPEEPPRRPDTLQAEPNEDGVNLTWSDNVEADLAAYRLYRESYSGFTPNPENLLTTTAFTTTYYTDSVGDITEHLYYLLTAVDTTGLESPPSNEATVISTGILEDAESEQHVPRTPYISGNYPNPFNSSTMIEYYIPDLGARPTTVQLIIYDILGKKVTTLVNEHKYPGHHQARWDGRRDDGRIASSGIYFARLHIWGHEFKSSAKLVLQK